MIAKEKQEVLDLKQVLVFKKNQETTLFLKRIVLLAIYFLIPVFISILYWYEDPVAFDPEMAALDIKIIHNLGSIFGIFSYIWMCFNILIITRIKLIENNFSVDFTMLFHTVMASVSLLFGLLHGSMLLLTGIFPDTILITGILGWLIFLSLMVLAIIFMTNRLIKVKQLEKLRKSAYKIKFKYNLNKILHNITMLAVFSVFVHTMIAFTAASSELMRAVYFGFFILTLFGWVSHKMVRALQLDPPISRRDPFTKGSLRSKMIQKPNDAWFLKLLDKIPSLYACFQCGTCSEGCPAASITDGAYNPRLIMEAVILGQQELLVDHLEPNVWLCSTCQKCVEQCPQKIELTEIFTMIKNECYKSGTSPESINMQIQMVFDNGLAIPLTPPIERRRSQLGLPEIKSADVNEIQSLLKGAHLDLSTTKEEENN
ncbi:MAG: 4Fe-4S dicluster domain-containing protein [Candidatus Lokiarchaeota archaeon]|nr:4Fe-4S dicluster domain-containing protein [Candidatus Lokiarchaeota archaeon]